MYSIACECGIDPVRYWDLTYGEIIMMIKVYSKNRNDKMQTDSVIAFHQANQIVQLVGIAFGNKQERPAIYESYPGIFPELEQKAAIDKSSQQNWQIMKARIEQYATQAAEKRKRGERLGNDSGRVTDTDNNRDLSTKI